MSPLLLAILAFVAVVTVCMCAYSIYADLFLRDQSRVGRRIDEQLRQEQRELARKSLLFKDLSGLPPMAEAGPAEELTAWQQFELMIEQSGVAVTPGRLLAYMAGAALGGAALGLLLTRGPVGLLIGLAAGPIPYLYVWMAWYNRQEKMLSQLPDAFDLMARVIRAGQTTSQALQAVADEFSPPLAAEFAFCFEQQNLGLPPEASLRELARRTGLLEIKIFVLGILVQQQAGGNLAELLEKLATVVRSRYRIRGKISAMTAEGRMQAAVLLALAPALFVLFYVMNPGYMGKLLDYPWVLGGIAVSEFIGALVIRNIINFDF